MVRHDYDPPAAVCEPHYVLVLERSVCTMIGRANVSLHALLSLVVWVPLDSEPQRLQWHHEIPREGIVKPRERMKDLRYLRLPWKILGNGLVRIVIIEVAKMSSGLVFGLWIKYLHLDDGVMSIPLNGNSFSSCLVLDI